MGSFPVGKVISALAVEAKAVRLPLHFRVLVRLLHLDPRGPQILLKVKRFQDAFAICIPVPERHSLEIQRSFRDVQYATLINNAPVYSKPIRLDSVKTIMGLVKGYSAIQGECRYVQSLDAIATNIDDCWYITKYGSNYRVLYQDTQVL